MDTEKRGPARLLHVLKGEIDDLIVQLSLGKAEAIDFVETNKSDLSRRIARVRDSLGGEGRDVGLKRKLDEVAVQLALGRMETRDAYEAQRGRINRAIHDARGEWRHLEDETRQELTEKAESLQIKLDALALDVGLVALVAEDELKVRKDEIAAQTRRLAEKLKTVGGEAGEEAESFAAEAKRDWDDLKDNLGRLFR
ncbi:MAG: hypothetical protein WD342_04580 [Verrucomicrobiales bacterium]